MRGPLPPVNNNDVLEGIGVEVTGDQQVRRVSEIDRGRVPLATRAKPPQDPQLIVATDGDRQITLARATTVDAAHQAVAEVAVLSGNTVSILLNTTPPGEFLRGDANGDGQVQITDAVRTLEALFVVGSPALACADSADSNDDGAVDLSDAVHLLNYLFVPDSAPPPAPGASACGADPTSDSLTACGASAGCP